MILFLTILFFFTQLGDWFTTRKALTTGKAKEANPIASFFIKTVGIDFFFAAKTIVVTILGYFIALRIISFLIVLILFYAWVVWHNFTVIRS